MKIVKYMFVVVILGMITYFGYLSANKNDSKENKTELKSLKELEKKVSAGEKVYIVAGCMSECVDLIKDNKETFDQVVPLVGFIDQLNIIDMSPSEIKSNQKHISRIFKNDLSDIQLYLFEDKTLQSSIQLFDKNQKPQLDAVVEFFYQTNANKQILGLIDKYLNK